MLKIDENTCVYSTEGLSIEEELKKIISSFSEIEQKVYRTYSIFTPDMFNETNCMRCLGSYNTKMPNYKTDKADSTPLHRFPVKYATVKSRYSSGPSDGICPICVTYIYSLDFIRSLLVTRSDDKSLIPLKNYLKSENIL